MDQRVIDLEVAHICNVINGNQEIALAVLRDCAETCGLVSKSDYSKIMAVPLRTVQNRCKKGKIIGLEVSGDIIPCINCNL